jgi:hypothetical protein
MLNPYRKANGWNVGEDGVTYNVDGIDDKLTTISNANDAGNVYPLFKLKSTCLDDMSSDWLSSYGDANTYDFLNTRPILMDGFVHNAEVVVVVAQAHLPISTASAQWAIMTKAS